MDFKSEFQYIWATSGQLSTAVTKMSATISGRCWNLKPGSLIGGTLYKFEVQVFDKTPTNSNSPSATAEQVTKVGSAIVEVDVGSEGVQAVLATSAAVGSVNAPIKIDGRKSRNLDGTGKRNLKVGILP